MAAKRDTGADRGVAYLDSRRRADELNLLRDGKGRTKACEHNAKQLLGDDVRYKDLHFDEFLGRVRKGALDWTDHDDRIALIDGLQAAHKVPGFTLGQVRNAIQALAFDRRRDSLRDYVKALPAWDRTERIEHAFCEAWGAAWDPLESTCRHASLSIL